MSTLYLHIGMPKTGTTYIQKFMRENSELLERNNYVYPDFGVSFEGIGINRNAHFLLSKNMKDENGELNEELRNQVVDKCFNRISELFATYENIVISDESFWNSAEKLYYNGHPWADLKKKSQEMNFDLKIVVYLRRQDLFVQSFWAQQVKETYTDTFEQFLEGAAYKRLKLDYYQRLSDIAEHIGKENMLVRVYENSQYSGTDNTLVSDFLDTLGLELTDEWQKPVKERLNRSLSGVYLETKRRMNAFDEFKVKMGWFSHLLQRTVDKNDDHTVFDVNLCFSDAQQLKDYIASFSESNSKVAKEFLGREDGVLFKEVPDNSEITASVTYKQKDIYKVLADALSIQHYENDNLKADAKLLKADIKNFKVDIKKLKAENKKMKGNIENLKTENKNLNKEVKELEARIAKVPKTFKQKVKWVFKNETI